MHFRNQAKYERNGVLVETMQILLHYIRDGVVQKNCPELLSATAESRALRILPSDEMDMRRITNVVGCENWFWFCILCSFVGFRDRKEKLPTRKFKFLIFAEDLRLNQSKLLLYRRRVAAFRLISSKNIGNSIF